MICCVTFKYATTKRTPQTLNAFLSQNVTDLEKRPPLLVFLTGASGAGKTVLTKALEEKIDARFTHIAYFDQIGVPTAEKMIEQFGSEEKWQENATFEWVQRLSAYKDKLLLILEGQFNPQFVVDACKQFNLQNFLLVLIHVQRAVRDKRLIEQRGQPELANDTMESWAQFLLQKTQELDGHVIDTSEGSLASQVEEVSRIILQHFYKQISEETRLP